MTNNQRMIGKLNNFSKIFNIFFLVLKLLRYRNYQEENYFVNTRLIILLELFYVHNIWPVKVGEQHMLGHFI